MPESDPIRGAEPERSRRRALGSDRRTFLTGLAALGLAGRTLLRTGDAGAARYAAEKALRAACAHPDAKVAAAAKAALRSGK